RTKILLKLFFMKKNRKHLLSINLESWVFSEKINAKNLSVENLRKLDNEYTPRALRHVLDLLKKHNQKITFFVVTKLEELYPGIIDEILKDGHEVAWHTHTHTIIKSPEILVNELKAAKKIIDKYSIRGFQPPEIIFVKEAYKILKEYGFLYASSIYGNTQAKYSYAGVCEIPVSVSNKNYIPDFKEIIFPNNMTIKNIFKFRIPFGSGLFWGILGKRYYLKKLSNAETENKIYNFFIHEWQLFPPQSKEYKKDVSFFANPLFSLYKINVNCMFNLLLSKYRFGRFIDYYYNNKFYE
ncbi:MAG: polysaccharide deacetylase family protein, partial [Promethearchaeota archaeon]